MFLAFFTFAWTKLILSVGFIFLLFVGIIYGLFYAFQERIIFHPQSISQTDTEKISNNYELSEEISFYAEDGKHLQGWLLHPQSENKNNRLLIYYGGNAEELSGQIPVMSDNLADWSVLLVNYRGYGKSEGSPREESLYHDALTIYDDIHIHFDDKVEFTALMGRSIGTAIATKVAAERNVNQLILISPFDSLTKVAHHHYPFLPISMMLRYSFDSLKRINEISAPILTIAADEDQIIPKERTFELIKDKESSVQYELINGRGHNDLHLDPRFWRTIRQFLSLKGPL